MIQDLRLHGEIGSVEFFAFVGGANSHNPYFYEEEESRIRFFSKGNEFIIDKDGIHYKGTGGNFCEYMFGVEKPLKDLQKKRVELFTPVQEAALNAVNEVAEENGFTYIFDTGMGSVVYTSPDSQDILALVKKKLGLE